MHISMQLILTFSFRLSKVVDINRFSFWSGQDFLPVDRSDVTEVIVIEESDRSSQDVY